MPFPLPQTGEHVFAKMDDPNPIGTATEIKMKTQDTHVKKEKEIAAPSSCQYLQRIQREAKPLWKFDDRAPSLGNMVA